MIKKYRLKDVFNCYNILENAIKEYVDTEHGKDWCIDDFDFDTINPKSFVCLVNISKYCRGFDEERKIISVSREELRKLINEPN